MMLNYTILANLATMKYMLQTFSKIPASVPSEFVKMIVEEGLRANNAQNLHFRYTLLQLIIKTLVCSGVCLRKERNLLDLGCTSFNRTKVKVRISGCSRSLKMQEIL